MNFLFRVIKAHAKKNASAADAISYYERGLITCAECLRMIADSMQN